MQLLFLAAMLAADDSLAGSSPSLSSPTATSYSVALKWKDPSSSEQKWTVERSTSSGGSFTVIATLSSNRTSYVDSRVVPNKTYYYRVSYLTSGGSTKYSDTEKVKTKSDTTVPVANITIPGPGGLVAGEVNLSASVTDQGGVASAKFYLDNALLGTSTNPPYSLNLNTKLLADGTHSVKVVAFDLSGNQASSPSVSFITDNTPPLVPVLTATANSISQVSLIWPASLDIGAAGLSHYNIYFDGTLIDTTLYPEYSLSGLVPETQYCFTVEAVDALGNTSALSAPACATTFAPLAPDTTAPSTPTGLAATSVNCNQISVSWIASADAGTGVRHYSIRKNGAVWRSVQAPATSIVDAEATGGTAYLYSVSATDFVGNESTYTRVSVTTPACPDTTAPTTPTGLAGLATDCHTASLSWNAATDDGGAGLKGYNLYRNGSFLKQVLAPATTTTDATLAGTNTYSFTISAVDNSGNESPRSVAASVSTPICPDTTAPSLVTNLVVVPAGCTTVLISWNASTDTGGSGLMGYKLYRNGQLLKSVSAPTTNVMDTGVSASSTGTYTVLSLDNAGNSSLPGSSVTATTPTCPDTNPPTVPGAVTATATSCGRVELAWTASSDTGPAASGLKEYRIYRNGQLIQTLPASVLAYIDTIVSAATPYTYAVAATDNANNSATSAGVSVTTPACPVVTNLPPASSLSGRFVAMTNIGTTDAEYCMSVAVDRDGNSIIGGSASGAPFLCKLSPSKVALWSLGMANAGSVQSVAVDAQGDVIFTGYFYATVNFGTASISSAGGFDIFVIKYTSSGQFVWAKRFGSNNEAEWAGEEAGLGIAVDSRGNIGVSGGYFGGADFDGQTLGRVGVKEGFLLMLNPDGRLLWVNTLSNSTPTSVAFDQKDNLIVGGNFSGTANMGGTTLVSGGSFDIFLAKFSPAGKHVWSRRTGGFSYDTINALTVDSSGDVVATGTYRLQANFEGVLYTGAGNEDIFIAKFNGTNGIQKWVKTFGTEYSELGNGIVTDAARNITVVGRFGSPLDFGDGLRPGGAEGNNAFVVKLDPDGKHIWSHAFGSGREDVRGISVDARGHLYIAGRFSYTVDFGGGPVTANGGTVMPDIFLLELEP